MLGTRRRHRGNQGSGVRVRWVRQHIFRRTLLDDPTQIHHGNFVADMAHDAQIMTDKEHGETHLLTQISQEVDHLCLY